MRARRVGVAASLAAAAGATPVAVYHETGEQSAFEVTLLKVSLKRVHPLRLALDGEEGLGFSLGDHSGGISLEQTVHIRHLLPHVEGGQHRVDLNPGGYRNEVRSIKARRNKDIRESILK